MSLNTVEHPLVAGWPTLLYVQDGCRVVARMEKGHSIGYKFDCIEDVGCWLTRGHEKRFDGTHAEQWEKAIEWVHNQ